MRSSRRGWKSMSANSLSVAEIFAAKLMHPPAAGPALCKSLHIFLLVAKNIWLSMYVSWSMVRCMQFFCRQINQKCILIAQLVVWTLSFHASFILSRSCWTGWHQAFGMNDDSPTCPYQLVLQNAATAPMTSAFEAIHSEHMFDATTMKERLEAWAVAGC